MSIRAAVIGCGFIGSRRARTARGFEIAVCCDREIERARRLSSNIAGATAVSDWGDVVDRRDIEAVFVATTHDALASISAAAARARKHVLVEKPAARSAAELDAVSAAAAAAGVCVRTGFNHRFHRALMRAREIVDSGVIGELMFIRGRYGHGGRPGYDREWRAVPELSGGGEAIDQGVHLLDLARWFLGDFSHLQGYAATYFWDMPVDDNVFFLLRTASQRVAQLHASWTEWKNTFSFEIYGRMGKLDIQGLGGSYGVERLAWYQMLPQMGPPDTTIYEYPMADDSWERESDAFAADIRECRQPSPGIADAQAALRIVEEIYRQSGR
jgi:predicted dehydrogenase